MNTGWHHILNLVHMSECDLRRQNQLSFYYLFLPSLTRVFIPGKVLQEKSVLFSRHI